MIVWEIKKVSVVNIKSNKLAPILDPAAPAAAGHKTTSPLSALACICVLEYLYLLAGQITILSSFQSSRSDQD